MDDSDFIASAMYGGAPSTEEQRQAMANAMRGQNQAQAIAGLLQGMSPTNPGLAAYGKAASEDAGNQLTQMFHAPLQGVNAQKGLAELADVNRRRQLLADTGSPLNQVRAGLWKALGGEELPSGFNTGDLTDQEFGTMERLQAAKERAQAMRDIHKTGGGMEDVYTPEAIAILGEQVHNTGVLPKVGAGAQGSWLRAQLANYLATHHPGDNLAANAAGYHANTGSLAEAVKTSDAMNRNEAKAAADLGILEQSLNGLHQTNSAFLNTSIQKLEQQSGNPAVAAFLTARQAAISQVSKVLQGAPGGAVTEGLRNEADELLRKDYSPSQFASALRVLRQDMARNKLAATKSVRDIKARTAGQQVPHQGLKPGEVLMYDSAGKPHGVPKARVQEARDTYGFVEGE